MNTTDELLLLIAKQMQLNNEIAFDLFNTNERAAEEDIEEYLDHLVHQRKTVGRMEQRVGAEGPSGPGSRVDSHHNEEDGA